jgi:hypothetical protein
VAGRFPLLTDENVSGPLIEGLKARGWDVVRVVDVLGERSVDPEVFAYAAGRGLALASTDRDCLVIARQWIEEARSFRLIYWNQPHSQRVAVGILLAAFERLANKTDPFAACIEYLSLS